jgi:hypothetical protein
LMDLGHAEADAIHRMRFREVRRGKRRSFQPKST